jgi:hypothetical protein
MAALTMCLEKATLRQGNKTIKLFVNASCASRVLLLLNIMSSSVFESHLAIA